MCPREPSRDTSLQMSRRAFFGAASATAALALAKPGLAVERPTLRGLQLRDDYVGRLCYNENPLGPSPAAMTAMSESISMGHRYGDWFADSLRSDLAALHGLPSSQIRAGCGATEMLRLCAYAFVDPAGNVVCPYPSYSQFPGDAAFLGAEVRYADLDQDYRINLNAMAALVDSNTTAVCLTNPNNPTATVLPAAAISDFVASLPPQVAVIIDEAYHEYVHDPGYNTAIDLVGEGARVVVLRTFSKVFGLAGVRIGYAVGHSGLIGSVAAWQIWGTVSRPALEASRAALTDSQHITDTVALNDQTKPYCFAEFDKMGLYYIPSETNFFMVDVGQDASQVAAELANRGILVRTGWGMPQHLRVSTGRMEEMESFITELRDILTGGGTPGDLPANTTAMYGNFPNPVRGKTRIVYSVAARVRVRLQIFDVQGRLVKTLVDGPHPQGHYDVDWTGRDQAGRRMPAGCYYYRMIAGDHTETRRMILL